MTESDLDLNEQDKKDKSKPGIMAGGLGGLINLSNKASAIKSQESSTQ